MSLLPQVAKGNIWCPLLIDHASRSRLIEAGLRTYMAVGKSALDGECCGVVLHGLHMDGSPGGISREEVFRHLLRCESCSAHTQNRRSEA